MITAFVSALSCDGVFFHTEGEGIVNVSDVNQNIFSTFSLPRSQPTLPTSSTGRYHCFGD